MGLVFVRSVVNGRDAISIKILNMDVSCFMNF